MNIAQIESEALILPADARASLAHQLLLSLEEISEPEFDRLWGEESARRLSRILCFCL
ncbi:MAG: addiction module antitoxin RelB [Methylococcaceae bacterium]|nr:MAG: addiction module antitoxin RelB [Methylococcaceae bacterium]